jgi:hypothetical protein
MKMRAYTGRVATGSLAGSDPPGSRQRSPRTDGGGKTSHNHKTRNLIQVKKKGYHVTADGFMKIPPPNP